MIIDNEFKDLIPALTDEEYSGLRESIIREGVRDALITWNDILLDGHNRYKIAQEIGLRFETRSIELSDREAAKQWIITNQLGRRNLTEQQASYLRGKLYKSNKQNWGGDRGNQYTNTAKPQNAVWQNPAEKIGKTYVVSDDTVRRDAIFAAAVDEVAEKVGEDAKKAILSGEASVPKKDVLELLDVHEKAPELVPQILSGEMPLSKAIKEFKRQEKIESRKEFFEVPLPDGKYRVIYVDPPWPVESIEMEKWQSPIEDKYPTMTLEEIATLPISELADETCSLFLWTTHAFLPSAFELIKTWGFKYFCCITWDKGGGWTQNGFHKRTEFLLYAYKGGININQYGDAIPTIIQEKKTIHSKKPDSIRELITSKTPAPRIELFARQSYDGWIAWGNEV